MSFAHSVETRMIAAFRRLVWGSCLAVALSSTPAFAGASIVGPVGERVRAAGFEFGPWVSLSVPTGLAGDVFDRGVSAGVSVTLMATRRAGAGLDFGYSRWPSPKAGAAMDDLLSRIGGTPISGTKSTMTALRGTLHLRVVPLPDGPVVPWVQAGMGVCRVSRRLELPWDQLLAAGWRRGESNADDASYEPIFVSSIGLDFKNDSQRRIGLDASYQWLLIAGESRAFTEFAVGLHASFGRW